MLVIDSPPRSCVEVHLFAAARAAVGLALVESEPGTLAEVLTDIERRFPQFAPVRTRCSFLVDEVAVHGPPETIDVPPGARLDVLPPFAGG